MRENPSVILAVNMNNILQITIRKFIKFSLFQLNKRSPSEKNWYELSIISVRMWFEAEELYTNIESDITKVYTFITLLEGCLGRLSDNLSLLPKMVKRKSRLDGKGKREKEKARKREKRLKSKAFSDKPQKESSQPFGTEGVGDF
jgi:hypothetical protein